MLFLAIADNTIKSQELLAKVTINHNQIQGTDASVFDNLQQTLEQFINDRQWTTLQFQKNERIVCNFNITVTKYDQSSNAFTCTALIQANRPVYNAAYTTTLYNNQDADFNFEFAQFDQLNFNEEMVDNQLTALIAYYAYLIIGLDLDTFSPLGRIIRFLIRPVMYIQSLSSNSTRSPVLNHPSSNTSAVCSGSL